MRSYVLRLIFFISAAWAEQREIKRHIIRRLLTVIAPHVVVRFKYGFLIFQG